MMKYKNKYSIFRRELPTPPCTDFNSLEGRKLFERALSSGFLESYFGLSSQFRSQNDPAFCGISTLTIVLNALQIDPGRVWKGPWRFYSEEMLDCCQPLEVVKERGISLDQLACVGRCNGAKVTVHHIIPSSSFQPISPSTISSSTISSSTISPSTISPISSTTSPPNQHNDDHEEEEEEEEEELKVFREVVRRVTSINPYLDQHQDQDNHPSSSSTATTFMICSYSRKTFSQTGDGHFSPIAGYDPISDSVLIMDVATFKYPPHWVPLPLLFKSMSTLDSETNQTRGYMLLSSPSTQPLIFLFPPSLASYWSQLADLMKLLSASLCSLISSSEKEESENENNNYGGELKEDDTPRWMDLVIGEISTIILNHPSFSLLIAMYHSGLISSATNTPTKNLENDQEEDEEEGEDEEESDFGNHHHQHQHGRSGNEQEGGNSPPPSPLIEWSVSRANLCHKLLDQLQSTPLFKIVSGRAISNRQEGGEEENQNSVLPPPPWKSHFLHEEGGDCEDCDEDGNHTSSSCPVSLHHLRKRIAPVHLVSLLLISSFDAMLSLPTLNCSCLGMVKEIHSLLVAPHLQPISSTIIMEVESHEKEDEDEELNSTDHPLAFEIQITSIRLATVVQSILDEGFDLDCGSGKDIQCESTGDEPPPCSTNSQETKEEKKNTSSNNKCNC